MRNHRFLLSLALCTVIPLATSARLVADQVALDVRLVHPTMKAGEKQTNHLRVALTGFELKSDVQRPPVNVALVLDRSGSMSGEKLRRAKEAAKVAIDRLDDDDIVSVVLYDSNVNVLVPATKATDRAEIKKAIDGVQPGGSTALFAGVSKGSAEVQKFLEDNRVNRVILLSDGLANVGPQSPQELEGLGRSLMKQGISVSTLGLGLGYNEDLMVALASVGGGNHAFIESADDLVAVFNREFDGLLSVVANDFDIEVKLAEGVRPVRLIGSEGDIEGQTVRIPLAQLYSRQQRYFVLETEVAPGEADTTRPVADVFVGYRNLKTETRDSLTSRVEARFSESDSEVADAKDLETYAFCALQITNEQNRRATALRDAGQVDKAKKLLEGNSIWLESVRIECAANGVTGVLPELKQVEDLNAYQSDEIADPAKWNMLRKGMRAMQNSVQQQQTYDSVSGSGSGR